MERTYRNRPRRVHYRSLPWAGALAAIASACATSIIYAVASVFDAFPKDVVLTSPAGHGPLTLAGVISASVIAAVVATGLYAFIGKVSEHPIAGFRVAVIVLLVSSLSTPFSVTGAPAGMIVSLMAMHIVVAAICYELLTRLARQ